MFRGIKKLFHKKKESISRMSSPRVFVTGVSGYVGGNLVIGIMEKHPEWHTVTLVRSEAQKQVVLSRWPEIEVVIGELDDKALMMEEASKADVILRTYSCATLGEGMC